MKKNQEGNIEIVFPDGRDSRQCQMISRSLKAGRLRKLAARIYTTNLVDPAEDIIKRHQYHILGKLYPRAVISHRSALEGGISSNGMVFLSYKYTRTIALPGLKIHLIKGPIPDEEDTPFLENLYIASQGRAFLENMQQSRKQNNTAKTLSRVDIEMRLNRLIQIFGQEELKRLRDQAKRVAARLGMLQELSALEKIIGALLGTQPAGYLETAAGIARAQGAPFDTTRVELFAALTAYLLNAELPPLMMREKTNPAMINQAFFESYFSNYIEGTQFAIEEAEKIIFENKIFSNRPEDSHDILSTFRLIRDPMMNCAGATSAKELIFLLRDRHAILMETRENTHPGQFKNIPNRAGSTLFVKPDEVEGTLIKGFEFYQKLNPGIARAIFMMFLIAEVHPFIDGNGRIARLFMNGELQALGLCRIIIPTVYREDYLLALRRLSRKYDPAPYVRMLLTAQSFTHSISFEVYNQALTQLKVRNAFMEPSEAKLIFYP